MTCVVVFLFIWLCAFTTWALSFKKGIRLFSLLFGENKSRNEVMLQFNGNIFRLFSHMYTPKETDTEEIETLRLHFKMFIFVFASLWFFEIILLVLLFLHFL